MSRFILGIEQSNKEYAIAKMSEGIIKLVTQKNVQPTLFELERVIEPDKGFKLKGDGEYFYRCRHGPLIPCSKDDADIFEYCFDNKLLKIKRPDEEYVCVFREGILMADQIIQVDWSTTTPTIKVGGSVFYFFMSPMIGSRFITSLYLCPIASQSNVCMRQGNYGKEVICCIDGSEKKFYATRHQSNMIVSIFKDKAEMFVIKNNTPYISYDNKLLPLIAGDQSIKGYQVSFPTTFINFYPL